MALPIGFLALTVILSAWLGYLGIGDPPPAGAIAAFACGATCHMVPGATPRGLRAFLRARIRFQLNYSSLIV